MQSTVKMAVKKYFLTTTLHGFKYLISPYYSDRIGWVICCIASACCAGILFAVVWVRFLNLPALLVQRQLSTEHEDLQYHPVPTIGFCQHPRAIAQNFLRNVPTKEENISRLADCFANAVQGKPTDVDQIQLLEDLFTLNNVSLLQVLYKYTPDCWDLTRKCRFQDVEVSCKQLFVKTLTQWGVCCVANTQRIINVTVPVYLDSINEKSLDVLLQCAEGEVPYPCELFTKYTGEEWVLPVQLAPGRDYFTYVTFVYEKDVDDDKLIGGSCVPSNEYSQRHCLLQCVEKMCGCYDPVSEVEMHLKGMKPCGLRHLACHKTYGLSDNSTCSCLPACRKVATRLSVESSPIRDLQNTLDPFYKGINATKSVYIRFKVSLRKSKVFYLMPTETWVTLLSSLGGVFNMFLGVGVFSALECLFFLLVKLPLAIRRLPEMY